MKYCWNLGLDYDSKRFGTRILVRMSLTLFAVQIVSGLDK